jgi:hypothetical protein
MEKNLILTGNELIAEFMGFKVIAKSFEDKLIYNIPTNNGLGYISYMMLYNKSWDWLMPVVEKIEETNFIKIVGKYCGINKTSANSFNNWVATEGVSFTNPKSKIESTYKAVVKFIKWHNKNKK